MRRTPLRALVLVLALTGCNAEVEGGGQRPTGTPSARAEQEPSPRSTDSGTTRGRESSYSDWELGARPLPLRPDGFGEIRPTPRELVERRFATVDLLPPPADGRFHASVGAVTPVIRRRMGKTWSPACPVRLDDLRYLTVSFRGFDGRPHTGELVVARTAAADVVSVFRTLFAAGFPIEEMRLPTTADLEARPTGDGNNTAGLVCRAQAGGSSWSAHAYGLAIDVNPFMNPYRSGDVVLPELASSYLRREWRRPGMIRAGSVVVRAFSRIGWSWGGAWSTLKDYHHFSATGR